MKERPIVFSSEMVQAILGGRKTQTRRIIKPQPAYVCNDWTFDAECGDIVIYHHWPHKLVESRGRNKAALGELTPVRIECPYGQPGDRLWVRERWATLKEYDHLPPSKIPLYDRPPMRWRDADIGAARHSKHRGRWRPARFMPRWASRITLEITRVRVERVQDISADDARLEGACLWSPALWDQLLPELKAEYNNAALQFFPELWNTINAKHGYSWDANPWIYVIEFTRILNDGA